MIKKVAEAAHVTGRQGRDALQVLALMPLSDGSNNEASTGGEAGCHDGSGIADSSGNSVADGGVDSGSRAKIRDAVLGQLLEFAGDDR